MAVEGDGDDVLNYTKIKLTGVVYSLSMTTRLFIEIEKSVRVALPKHVIRGDSDRFL